ncbi:hypothetical protein BC941DRAFT_434331 [Chlamydoabsidia padenii]|nr:hypothetical protein BC941DRAFT_434331 [Chlamydoabsidia padenii]
MSSDVHGRKRERTTTDAIKARREKEAVKIVEYNDTIKECHDRVDASLMDKHTLNLTTQILHNNPDYYTIWNIRRNILMGGILLPTFEQQQQQVTSKDVPQDTLDDDKNEATNEETNKDEEANQKVYLQELDLFMQLIRINPKSYWLWNHRRWCLESMPRPSWTGELKLVDKMLSMDERNFHGWNYRRYVVGQLRQASKGNDQTIVQHEYDFTTQKITQSFSNYSAWHQRSKLLPEIVMNMTEDEKNKVARNELAMVGDAIFTDPDDQSAWLYYWWLLGQAPSPITMIGAFQPRSTSHIIIGFNGVVGFSALPKITTNSNNLTGNWYTINISSSSTPLYGMKHSSSSVWLFVPNETQQLDQDITVHIQSDDIYPVSSAMTVESGRLWKYPVKLIDSSDKVTDLVSHTINQGKQPRLIQQFKDPIKTESNVWYSLDSIQLLKEAIALLRELLDLEPDSKWTLLTLVHFLQQLKLRSSCQKDNTTAMEELDDESIQILDRLTKLDYYRKEHYLEMKGRIEFTRQQDKLWKTEKDTKDDLALLLHLLQLESTE